MARQPSRPKRWTAACGKCLAAFVQLDEALQELETATEELKDVKAEYEEWKDNLPENVQSSTLGEKLEAVCELDIDGMHTTLEEAINEQRGIIEEAESIDLPQGFGRD